MEYPIITKEKNKWGEYKVIEQRNGIKVKLLEKPSALYRKKMDRKKKEAKKEREVQKKVDDRNKLINEKIRELAIQELKKEGKL